MNTAPSPTTLIESVVDEFELPGPFSPKLLQAAKHAAHHPISAKREDFRQSPLFTIDGADARDFDDAVAGTPTSNGGIKLLVAIADVAAFVPPHGDLDTEAARRGNSVYLPDRVLPMLPPALSNDACSLAPDKERLCLVCEMEIFGGTVKRYRFVRGLMRSQQRLNYDEAAEQINNHSGPLRWLGDVANAFRQARQKRGSFMIERPEMRVLINNTGDISSVLSSRNIAHYAIEECMIAANCCAADFIIRHHLPALHRAHPKPPAENIAKLRNVLAELGVDFPAQPAARDFSVALDAISARDAVLGDSLLPLFLGSLARADYRPDEKIGHFGLSCQRYLHFTSPIRRYPDLLTHRIIIAALEGKPSPLSIPALERLGTHCSQTEVTADKANWECQQRLLCWQARHQKGMDFECVVSGVAAFGVFVAVPQLGLDGLVRVSNLPGYWRHDRERQQFVADQNGQVLGLGSRLVGRLMEVIPDKGRADFKAVDLSP